ncbi:MAG: S41 family peptidase [Bacteroidales bacterium]
MNKIQIKPYLPILFAIVLAAGVIIGLSLNFNTKPRVAEERNFFSIGLGNGNDKVSDIINYIDDSYVDSVDQDELTEEAIVSLLSNLDPHSSYIPAESFRDLNDPLMGSFEGIGIEFNMITDTVVVINPVPGGPSEKVGLMAGDRIIRVEDEIIAGKEINTQDVVRKLKGPKGTEVNVSVMRRGVDDLLEFTITRDEIPSYSLDIAYMIDSRTGYIKLGQFSATTHSEFQTAMDRLKRNGMQQMILDLRGNGGGFLDAAIKLADEFLTPESLIVYTQGRMRPKTIANAKRNGGFEEQPLIVLIDEWSASASEIIAGAIQDHDRGLVVGRRSFGKGLVQEQVQLEDGSALRLTVARYYTPSGRSIQKPYENGNEEYYADFMERYRHGELETADSIQFNDSLKYTTQSGRIVYGGGGIMPDVFVPLQVEQTNGYFNEMSNRGLIYRFAFDYADQYRKDLKKFDDAESFVENFTINQNITNQFIQFGEENGVSYHAEEFEAAKTLINSQIKAYVGRNIFGNDAFYPVINNDDPAVNKALELFGSEKMVALMAPN